MTTEIPWQAQRNSPVSIFSLGYLANRERESTVYSVWNKNISHFGIDLPAGEVFIMH